MIFFPLQKGEKTLIKNSKKLIALLFVFAMLQSNFAGAVVPHLPDLVQNGNLWKLMEIYLL